MDEDSNESPGRVQMSPYIFLSWLVFIALTLAGLAIGVLGIVAVAQGEKTKFIASGFIMAACFGMLSVFGLITRIQLKRWNNRQK